MPSHNNRWLRAAAIVTIVAFMPLASTACFGKFQLIRKVYKFNKEVDPDKWVQWFVFIVLSVVPIYGLAALIDAVFANSVEFWTGENPIIAGTSRTLYGENGEIVRATFNGDRTIDLVVIEADGTTHALSVAREGDTLAARDADGFLLGRMAEIDLPPQLIEAK